MTTTDNLPREAESGRSLDGNELVERLAEEMRVASGGELPLAFCIEQVRRKLAGKPEETGAANQQPASEDASAKGRKANQDSTAFHSWALPH